MASKAKKPKATGIRGGKRPDRPDLTGNPEGRPTDYTPDMPAKLNEYFSPKAGEYVPIGNKMCYVAASLPTFAGFCVSIGVSRRTIMNWRDEYPEFFLAYERAKTSMEHYLTEGALNGGYNAQFAIFAAKNMIGWHDKQELTATVTITERPADLTAVALGSVSTT